MTAADLEALFDRWRAGDETAAAAFFAADGVFHEAAKPPIAGRNAIAAHWAPFFRGGPEWRMTVHEVFGNPAGDRYAVTYTWEMKTSAGEWAGKPGCAIVQTAGGKIALWREYKG